MSSSTPLEGAIAVIIGVFEKYASKDDNSKTLSRAEVKTLIEKELPMFVQDPSSKKGVQEMFTELEDGSGEVDFCGFMSQVANLVMVCKSVLDQN
ncbi:protein S100-P-like [Takifugu flavidus]|uniref:Protein S100-P n=1 Tax=Takifugu flavidus TaxID=433684 RepID=A0A5C6N9G0_9TELE|nr:protein S100-P-like [Takifugu flavidus]TWW63735.1 Protein S100-P [Takifugu flavidus]